MDLIQRLLEWVARMAHQLKNLMGAGIGAESAKLINGLVQDGIAATGSTQVDAFQITLDVNIVTTVSSGTGVRLPPIPQPGDDVLVGNFGANTLNVYPPISGAIGNGATNTPYQLNAGFAAQFTARLGSSNWIVLSAGGSAPPPPSGSGQLDFSKAANSGLFLLLEEM